MPILFPGMCLYFAISEEPLSKSWYMTDKDFGCAKSACLRGKFCWWPDSKRENSRMLAVHELQLLLWNGNPEETAVGPSWKKIELPNVTFYCFLSFCPLRSMPSGIIMPAWIWKSHIEEKRPPQMMSPLSTANCGESRRQPPGAFSETLPGLELGSAKRRPSGHGLSWFHAETPQGRPYKTAGKKRTPNNPFVKRKKPDRITG
jgi:hypothetical protein